MAWFALGLFLVFLSATGVKETILRFAWWWPLMAILSGFGAWHGLKSAGCFKAGRVR